MTHAEIAREIVGKEFRRHSPEAAGMLVQSITTALDAAWNAGLKRREDELRSVHKQADRKLAELSRPVDVIRATARREALEEARKAVRATEVKRSAQWWDDERVLGYTIVRETLSEADASIRALQEKP